MCLFSNKKSFQFVDFIRIPLKITPVYTLVKLVNKIVGALIPSLQVLITAGFIDTAVAIFNGQKDYPSIFLPLAGLIAIVLYDNLNWSLMSFINLKSEMKMTEEFRSAVVEKRAKLEYRHIENNDTWDLIQRTCSDPVGKISGGFDNVLGAADIVIRVFSLLLILMTQVWWAGLVIVGISVPLFFLALKGGRETYKANKEAEKHNRRAGYLHDVLSSRENIEERALFGYTDSVNQKWYEKFETARKINLKVQLKYFIRLKGSSLITVLITIIIIGVLLFPLSSGAITSGMFVGLVTATLNLVQMMSWQLNGITSQLATSREYLKDLTAFAQLSEKEGALDLPVEGGIRFESLEFKNVSFQYPDTDMYILKNFNLTMIKNMHYAFVGVNGAGKTTITKLLTGMYDNFEGEILINGKSIHEYPLAQLKALFSVVYQDFAKYSVSLKDNIALGNVLHTDEERIRNAASVIGLDPVLDKLKNGMDTNLGKIKEGGVDLSGGEWQRVAIARALYNQAEIQILDEPTSALDPVAESNLYEMFGRLSAGKSTIFITHRLGAARLADEIIVIDGGCVAEKGSHDALLKKGGIYAEMFESQRSWYQC